MTKTAKSDSFEELRGILERSNTDETKSFVVTFAPKRGYAMDEGDGTTESRDTSLHFTLWPSIALYMGEIIIKLHGIALEPRCPQPVMTTGLLAN